MAPKPLYHADQNYIPGPVYWCQPTYSDGTLTNKIKASDAADLAARPVLCTCYWNEDGSADHAQDCDKDRAWQRAYDTRLDELEAEDEHGVPEEAR